MDEDKNNISDNSAVLFINNGVVTELVESRGYHQRLNGKKMNDELLKNSELHFYKSLKDVRIPYGVTKIADFVFVNCESLENVIIPDSVTEIGISAFSKCRSLKSIVIPDSVTEIGISAFSNCRSLKSIAIPKSVTKIKKSTFVNCESLENVIIPDSVTEIGISAFSNCRSLKSIVIPKSVTEIGIATFSNSGLESIIIPEGVTKIGDKAFLECGLLKELRLPKTVESIGSGAFYKCISLKGITIPITITEINSNFSDCNIPLFFYLEDTESFILTDAIKNVIDSRKLSFGFENEDGSKAIDILNKCWNERGCDFLYGKKIVVKNLKENLELLSGIISDEDIIILLCNNDLLFSESIVDNFYENFKYLVSQRSLIDKDSLETICFGDVIALDISDSKNFKETFMKKINNIDVGIFNALFCSPNDKNKLELRNRLVVCSGVYSDLLSNINGVKTIIKRNFFDNLVDFDNNKYISNYVNPIDNYYNFFSYKKDGVCVFDGIKYHLTSELMKINPEVLNFFSNLTDSERNKFMESLSTIKNWDVYGDRKIQATMLKNEIVGRVMYSIVKKNYEDKKSKAKEDKIPVPKLDKKFYNGLDYAVDLDFDYLCVDVFNDIAFEDSKNIDRRPISSEEKQKIFENIKIIKLLIENENPYIFDIFRGKKEIHYEYYKFAYDSGYLFSDSEEKMFFLDCSDKEKMQKKRKEKIDDVIANAIINDIGLPSIVNEEVYLRRLNSLIDVYFNDHKGDLMPIFRAIGVYLEKNYEYYNQGFLNADTIKLSKDIFDEDNDTYNDVDRLLYCLFNYNRLAHSIDTIKMKEIQIDCERYKNRSSENLGALKNALSSYNKLQEYGLSVENINSFLLTRGFSSNMDEFLKKYSGVQSSGLDIYSKFSDEFKYYMEKNNVGINKINKDIYQLLLEPILDLNKIEKFSNEYGINEEELKKKLEDISNIYNSDELNSIIKSLNDSQPLDSTVNLLELSNEKKLSIIRYLNHIRKISSDSRNSISEYAQQQRLFFNVKSLIAKRFIDNLGSYLQSDDCEIFFKNNGYIVEKQVAGNSNVLVCYNPKFQLPFAIHMPNDRESVGNSSIVYTKINDGLVVRSKVEIKETEENGMVIKDGAKLKIKKLYDPGFIDSKNPSISLMLYSNFFKYDVLKIKSEIENFCNIVPKPDINTCRSFENYILNKLPISNWNIVYDCTGTDEINVMDKYKNEINFSKLEAFIQEVENNSGIGESKRQSSEIKFMLSDSYQSSSVDSAKKI